jgi:hypothetical protein
MMEGLFCQRIIQHVGVTFDDIQLQQLWTMAENFIPALEHRAAEEKPAKSGQAPLFHFSKGATVKTLVGNRGTGKYIEGTNQSGEEKYRLNQVKIEEDAKFGGLHAIETDRAINPTIKSCV